LTIGDLAARPGPQPVVPTQTQPRHNSHGPGSGRLPNPGEEIVTLIETNLDDMNPQYYDFVMERLLGQGALDVFLVPVQMKKNRPGVVLSVICTPEAADLMAATIFEETTTLGLRVSEVPRRTLQRDLVEVYTHFGPIKVKVARNGEGKVLHVKPEYEEVKRIALELNLPIDKVYEEARQAWEPQLSDGHQRSGRHRSAPIGLEKEAT
jgi:hypothetical protein